MDTVYQIALGGGLFSVLALVHFVVDWVFQSHSEAMAKHNNAKVRARHCLVYTVGFIPILYLLHFSVIEFMVALTILFVSHFIEDTYYPVFLWAKYIRRPPEMTEPWKESYTRSDGLQAVRVHPPDAKHGFMEFIQTTLGKILMIAIDQIIHLLFLIPLVWMALN